MITLLIVVGLIGGTCAIIWGMVMLAMMLGNKSKKAAAARAATKAQGTVTAGPSSAGMPSPGVKRVHTT